MRTDRAATGLRPMRLTTGVNKHAEGSALVEWGDTRVHATASLEAKLPPHMRNAGTKSGWLTAEYAMLPRSTSTRSPRERLYGSGRTQEIQRLIGRSLRAVTRLDHFRGQTLTVDVDVLQADGGTRCAGIVAGYAALHHLSERLVYNGKLAEWPLAHEIAAVSVGMIDGTVLVDLEAEEDSASSIDLNIIATADGSIVEVQGGSEGDPVAADTYVTLVANGVTAVQNIVLDVRRQLAGTPT